MKKSRFLALIMVVAVMLMGAGYAQWCEMLTIDATAATGELNMDFLEDSWVGNPECCYGCDLSETSYITATNGEDGNTQSIAIVGMVPGMVFQYEPRMENVGDAVAMLNGITASHTEGSADLFNQIAWKMKFGVKEVNVSHVDYYELSGTGLGNIGSMVEDFLLTHEIVICPGEKLVFDSGYMKFWLACTDECNNETMNLTTGFDVNLDFVSACCTDTLNNGGGTEIGIGDIGWPWNLFPWM